ncbi:hypothetical protein CE195_04695, partial [Sodalis-like symbiont of Philaenus spumarius]
APNAPKVFQQEWQPEIKLDLDTASSQHVTTSSRNVSHHSLLSQLHSSGCVNYLQVHRKTHVLLIGFITRDFCAVARIAASFLTMYRYRG